jgi:hypothetical protein
MILVNNSSLVWFNIIPEPPFMLTFLKIGFSAILIFMCYEVISTSLESNLFEQWDFLGSIPWMRATLFDFYANVLVIFVWVCYKEKGSLLKVMWFILLVCLGSIASCIYVLIQLFKLKKGEGLTELFAKR